MASLTDPSTTSASGTHSGVAAAQLRGRALLLVRVAWLALALLTVALFLIGVPLHPARLHIICAGVTCDGTQSPAEVARQLGSIGLSVAGYATFVLCVKLLFALGYFAVAALIFLRRSDNWMALLVALFLVTFAFIYTDVPGVLANDQLSWWWLVGAVAYIGNIVFPICLFLFPGGHFAPRWTRWLLVVWLLVEIPASFLPNSPLNWDRWPVPLEALVVLAALGSVVFTQIYRYRHRSSSIERRQTKWAVFGLAAGLGLFFAAGLFGSVGPRVIAPLLPGTHWLASPWVGIVAITLTYLALLLIPLLFALAILRSHLWDIDLIINRTLVYSLLTLALAAVYVGCVLGSQALVQLITGRSDLPAPFIVGSTLLIAALFDPLRRRIQRVIDQRFYRGKVDAVRTLHAFSERLRNEVDLAQLRVDLLDVVQETIQPTYASLWLVPAAREAPPDADQATHPSMPELVKPPQSAPHVVPMAAPIR